MARHLYVDQGQECEGLLESEPQAAGHRSRWLIAAALGLTGLAAVAAGGVGGAFRTSDAGLRGATGLDEADLRPDQEKAVLACGETDDLVKLLQNNFGNKGPDTGDEGIKWLAKQYFDGIYVRDVVIEANALTEYTPMDASWNGLHGEFGAINVPTGKSVKVRFSMKHAKTGEPMELKGTTMTVYDLDSDGVSDATTEDLLADPTSTMGREYVRAFGKHHSGLDKKSSVHHEEEDGHHVYSATLKAVVGDNPEDPRNLNKVQMSKAVGFGYKHVPHMDVELGSTPGAGFRIFEFAFLKLLGCKKKVVKPPPPPTAAPAPAAPAPAAPAFDFTPIIIGAIVLLAIVYIVLRHRNWRYRSWMVDAAKCLPPSDLKARQAWALAEMKTAVKTKNSFLYRQGLELALDAKMPPKEIPLVFQLNRMLSTFDQLKAKPVISLELCFVLDFTGSMGVQMKQVKSCIQTVKNEVSNLKMPHMPNTKINLSLSAVAYNDFDAITAKKGRPVVSIFGGREMKESHSPQLNAASFNLGGKFTTDGKEIEQFVSQDLGHGGEVPEELTGGLIATSHLPWSADIRLAVVITDAPCHGSAYHGNKEDTFADPRTGLTGSGDPVPVLRALKEKKVELIIAHTGNVGQMIREFKKEMPLMKESKVNPAETGAYIVRSIKERFHLQPLTYIFSTYGLDDYADTAPEKNLTLNIEGCGANLKSMTTNNEGLVFFGLAGEDFSGTPQAGFHRPDDALLDPHWHKHGDAVKLCQQWQDRFVVPYFLRATHS